MQDEGKRNNDGGSPNDNGKEESDLEEDADDEYDDDDDDSEDICKCSKCRQLSKSCRTVPQFQFEVRLTMLCRKQLSHLAEFFMY